MSVGIRANNIVVEYPIYNASHRSLKNTLLNVATGGSIISEASGKVVVRALDNVSFEFRHGDRVGIQGHNGAGKTTLLRVLAGIYEPIHGDLKVDGKIVSFLDISIGMDTEATGYENIILRGLLLGFSIAEIKTKMESIIEFSELGEYINMPIRTYSSGMVMRLAFSIAINVQADILLMDEWLSVGDSSFVEKAEKRLREKVNQTPILVIASHNPMIISDVCNRSFRLDHGKMVESELGKI